MFRCGAREKNTCSILLLGGCHHPILNLSILEGEPANEHDWILIKHCAQAVGSIDNLLRVNFTVCEGELQEV